MSLTKRIGEILLSQRAFEDNPLTEQGLAQRFGLSRTPIREALLELENQDIVIRRQRKGVYLRVPEVQEIQELFIVRANLEGLGVRMATTNSRRVDLEKLQSLSAQIIEAEQAKAWEKADDLDQFMHESVVRLSGNSILQRMTGSFALMRSAFVLNYLETPPYIADEPECGHSAIIERMLVGDASGAEAMMKQHIISAGKRTLDFVSNAN